MASIIRIGRTNYYSVRKGTQQYCVAEGKRLQDAEFCWQAVKNPETGKTFFISGSGVRRWHLPDIHLTERERLEEEREIRFRKEQRAAEEARLAKQKAGDAAVLTADAPSFSPLAENDDANARFASRDRAAMRAVLLPGWETVEKRLPVTRFIKSVLQPHVTQNLLDERTFSQLVTTLTREHCSVQPPPFSREHEAPLRENALTAAKQRTDEERRRAEFEKLTEELKDKVRRLEAERRKMQTNIDSLTQSEEKMRDELFALRAHKQDTLLNGFKRLTRVGLINAYWERWVKYKSVVDAQLHVKARERRQMEMIDRLRDLESTIHQLTHTNAELRARVQQQQGRDVVSALMNSHGKSTQRRYYLKWLAYVESSKKDKELFKARQMLIDCPTCKLRGIEIERLHDRLSVVMQEAQSATIRCEAAIEENNRYRTLLEESNEAKKLSADFSRSAASHAASTDENNRALRAALHELRQRFEKVSGELQRLQYETSRRATSKPDAKSPAIIDGSTARSMSHFFVSEAQRASETAHTKVLTHQNAGVPPMEHQKSGRISIATEQAIAPAIVSKVASDTLVEVEKSREVLRKASLPLSILRPPPLSRATAAVLDNSFTKSETSSSSESTSSSDTSGTRSESESDSEESDASRVSQASSGSEKGSAEALEDRCERCSFSKRLAPFCPVDGSRHIFAPTTHQDPLALQKNYSSLLTPVGMSFAGSDRALSLQFSRSEASAAPARRDVLADATVLTLPPGRRNNEAEAVRQDPIPPPIHVLPHTAALRASLSKTVDPRTYQPMIFQSTLGVVVREPQSATQHTVRETADYMRTTHLEASRRQNQSVRNINEESLPSLSLESRMFSTKPAVSGRQWDQIFEVGDDFGVSSSDAVFGIFRRDELPLQSQEALQSRGQATYRDEMARTPNMVVRQQTGQSRQIR